MNYDLEERTARFGENVIHFCKKVPRGPITDPLITQLVKCGIKRRDNSFVARSQGTKLNF